MWTRAAVYTVGSHFHWLWTFLEFAMPPPADIVKVAIEWPGAYPKLMEIDQVSKAGSHLAVILVSLLF